MGKADLSKSIRKVKVYVNGFGDVPVPVTKPENREDIMIQSAMLREVLTSEIIKIKNSEKDYSPQELKQLVEAVNLNNEISMKALGDHKDSRPLEYSPEQMQAAQLGEDSILESGLKDVLKKIKARKQSVPVEAVATDIEDLK